MVGGPADAVAEMAPIFDRSRSRARRDRPHARATRATPCRPNCGWLHCGPSGAGHFVKMVHNGIEYGMMAAYAEGLNILAEADVGAADRPKDAETAPLTHPEYYQYDFDLAAITELWRRGSVVSSWLLDLTAAALGADPAARRASRDTSATAAKGAGRLHAAIDEGVPVPVLSAALYDRFYSRGTSDDGQQDPVGDARPVRWPCRRNGARENERTTHSNRLPMPSCCSARPATSPSASCSPRCTTSSVTATSKMPGDRRRPQRLDRRGVLPERPRRDHRRRSRCRGRRHRLADEAARPHPGRLLRSRRRGQSLQRHARQAQERDRRVLHGDPADDVPHGRPVAGVGRPQRARPDRGREAVRPRPGQRRSS